jgi:tetratricopeptide (TPR) repeat protein
MSLDARAAPRVAEQLLDLRERRGDGAGAARVLEVAFSHNPSNARLRDRLVAHYEEQGQWPHAAAALRRALEASPKDRTLLVKLLGAYQRSGAHGDIVRTLDAALAARPQDAELLVLRATAREHAGDVDGALTDLEAACSVDTRRLGALAELLGRAASREGDPAVGAHALRLAEVLVRLNRPSEARAALERLRARGPRSAETLRRIALVASEAQDWGAAADAYRDLVAIDDAARTPEAVLSLASALLAAHERAGRVEEAQRLLARPLDELARDPAHGPDVERLREAVGDWKGLSELLVLRAERQLEGDEKVALLTRAARLRLDKDHDPAGALAMIERGRAAAPASLELSLLWARAQTALGRPDEALAVLGEAVSRGRIPRPTLAALHLEVAKAHLSVDGIVEAWRALKSAFAADPRDGEISMMLGLLSIDLEDQTTAERALMSVTTASSRVDAGTRALAFFHLARMAHEKHDTTKARLLATKAAEGDPKNQAVRRLLEQLSAPSSRRASEHGAQ